MAGSHACCTIFFGMSREDVVLAYEGCAEPADGYLAQMGDAWLLTDAAITETVDWGQQAELAARMTGEEGMAISLFLSDEIWGLALARAGQPGPTAAFMPEEADICDLLPQRLLRIEQLLTEWFPDDADAEELDRLFGALIEGAVPPDEAFTDLVEMLGCPPDWLRWSWYESIPHQLLLDADLHDRVMPLGAAREFWEE